MAGGNYVTQFQDFKPSGRTVNGRRVGFGVDLDGCVDMGMEKHLLAFGAASVCHFGLQPIQNVAMKAWMYVNFFSMDRGVSRFVTLYKWADIVNSTRAASSLGLSAPDFKYLRRWASFTSALSPEALSAFIESGNAAPILSKGESAESAFEELSSVLEWSGRVDALVPEATAHMRAFPNAVAAIQEGYSRGVDYAIVSGTPQSHIETMAVKYGIANCLEALWGQQAGRKSHALATMMIGPLKREELEAAIELKRPLLETRPAQYDVLTMVGDSPKDNAEREKANLALSGNKEAPIRMRFIPVEAENDAWGLLREDLDAVVSGEWSLERERQLIQEGLSKLDVAWQESPVYAFGGND